MYIYKITNKQNNKCYIGQTIRPVEQRWNRHKNDAINNKLDTHFARAIRYYGPENFLVEVIDIATSQEELTKKEQYWIQYYNTTINGYNETDAIDKCGGNTYKSKSPEELAQIGERIKASKMGGKNPHSTKVKCKNVLTNEEYHFDCQADMRDFFNEKNHQFISRRCLNKIKCLYKNQWLIAYEDNDYISDYTIKSK